VPEAQKLVLNWPLTVYSPRLRGNFKLKGDVTLIVLGIMVLIAALAKVSYRVVANLVTT
jgi:hypothetical protein